MLTTILATVVVLGVLIFVHELGHFVTAKLVDIEVPRFSLGLGPKLWGFRRGETEYVISWLPLGGYVKMAGMEEMEPLEGGKAEVPAAGVPITDASLVSEEVRPGARPRDFESKSLPARALVISAGVLMNYAFAFIAFAAMALAWGVERVPEARIARVAAERLPAGTEALARVPAGARVLAVGDREVEDWGDVSDELVTAPAGPLSIRFEDVPAVQVQVPAADTARAALVLALQPMVEPVFGRVLEDSPAAEAGLRPGDRVLEAAGRVVRTWQDLVEAVQAHPGERIELVIERAPRVLVVDVVPEPQRVAEAEGEPAREIGVIGVAVPREHPGLVGAVSFGAAETWGVTRVILDYLVDLFSGNVSPRSLGGPIMIGQMSGEVARAGVEALLRFMALLSINLAILNLLPIPVLDGGHLLFLGIEAVRGRALSLEQRMRLSQVGLVIVLTIMVWAIASDVLRLFGL